ncbi:uncharacterized protein SPAPADRAFT_61636 [Spathaspora passalidarum NRRL Y-27907]|uniref:Uncharacterized protein n=1 Tax=Spathaspora passalidarum (strain NRRL Y-27907 / 11-Y1) TaxID=619300 RepID=G3ANN7_SPAPN|nr:uncharacterized protein SPAPADRAFT_61636 [Spathaspora passalidarum NRRL Y-27907]EGW32566.1 hypothetical protein SPAPADRAFT_61636 [Spathaspora passalidarum NRRL Y-27907]
MSGQGESTLSPHEEDWSIISSCSDNEDDPSTAGFPDQDLDYSLSLSDRIKTNHVSDSVSNSILQVPELITSTESSKATVKINESEIHDYVESREDDDAAVATDAEIVEDDESQFTPSSSSDIKSQISIGSDQYINVAPKINFYENLSKFNDSIKQKSNEFYSNYAKVKMDQLNNYLADQHPEEIHEGEIDPTLNQSELKIEAEDSPGFESSAVSTPSSTPVAPPTIVLPYWKRCLLRGIDYVKDVLDCNSDYLYYYFVGITIGIFSLGFGVRYLWPAPVIDHPMTTMEKVNQFWDSIIYEEEVIPGNIFSFSKKKQKINKWVKYSSEFEISVFDATDKIFKNVWDKKSFREFSIRMNEFYISTNHTLYPLVAKAWENAKVMRQEARDNLEEWGKVGFENLDKYSRIGIGNLDKYGRLGWIKFRENGNNYMELVKEYGIKGWVRADEYSAIGYKYVVRGTERLLTHSARASNKLVVFMESFVSSGAEIGGNYVEKTRKAVKALLDSDANTRLKNSVGNELNLVMAEGKQAARLVRKQSELLFNELFGKN